MIFKCFFESICFVFFCNYIKILPWSMTTAYLSPCLNPEVTLPCIHCLMGLINLILLLAYVLTYRINISSLFPERWLNS